MGLTRPGWPTFLGAVFLGGFGIALKLGYLEPLAPLSFWSLAGGFLLLVLGVLFPRM